MVQKIAIVTGCDKGIGKEIVTGLAEKNYNVINNLILICK